MYLSSIVGNMFEHVNIENGIERLLLRKICRSPGENLTLA